MRLIPIALAFLLLGATLPPRPAAAQSAEAVAATITRLFDAMRAGDGAALAALFHEDARLQSVVEQNGAVSLASQPIPSFVQAVAAPRNQVWDERISDLEIRVDGRLATAWMRYAFYVDDQFSHCGVNAFQLVEGAEGWRIVQVTDTRRREGCGTATR